MSKLKRTTVYLDPDVHQALTVKAEETEQSVSGLVNAAVQRSLNEDVADLAVFEARAREPVAAFEAGLRVMKRRGKL